MLVTCPDLGHLVAVEFRREETGLLARVTSCSGRSLQGTCGQICRENLNRKIAALLATVDG